MLRSLRRVAVFYLSMACLIAFSASRLDLKPDTSYNWTTEKTINHDFSLSRIVSLWDGAWYMNLARDGYIFKPGTHSNVAFLPLYPLLLATLKLLFGNFYVPALLINFSALSIAVYFLEKLSKTFKTERSPSIFMLTYPTVIFFCAAYTEALFLALSIACIYYLHEKRLLIAAILGCLAALTRIPGLFLIIPFTYYLWQTKVITYKNILIAGLIPLGTGLYLLAQKIYTGNALAFLEAQQAWGRHFFHPNINHVYFATPAGIVNSLIDLSATALLLLSCWYIYKKLDKGLGLYSAVVILVPLATGSPLSIVRFGMVLFPLYLLIAKFPKLSSIYTYVSLPLMTLYVIQFVHGYWAG